MSTDKNDISQITKYLKGKLDARAMHLLEHDVQDDPFLAESLEGYEASGKDQQANIEDLQSRLAKRVESKKGRTFTVWRVLATAACLLLMLGIGYWFFANRDQSKQVAVTVKPNPVKPIVKPATGLAKIAVTRERKTKKLSTVIAKARPATPAPRKDSLLATIVGSRPLVVYKTDTVEYRASDYKVKSNSSVDESLKHMEGMEVNSDGSLTHQGQPVTKARLNGKDFKGGDVNQAIQNLPANIVSKIQIVDDYGDQAGKTGVKSGDPTKVLNISTDTSLFMRKSIRGVSPIGGLNDYMSYIENQATMPDSTTGKVFLQFKVATNGTLSHIRVINGSGKAMNKKAINIVKKGPKWLGAEKPKKVDLEIVFHK